MIRSRYRASRQKSCRQCSNAKTKCDWGESSTCTRCARRGLHCVPPSTAPDGHNGAEGQDTSGTAQFRDLTPRTLRPLERSVPSPARAAILTPGSTPASVHQTDHGKGPDLLEFSNLDLICPIDSEAISTRWLNSYIPLPEQVAKNYPPAIISFIRRMLKAYASIAIRGHGFPPFIHPLQLKIPRLNASLTACLNLVRTCDGFFSDNLDSTADILKGRMAGLYNDRDNQNEAELLATFQSYLIYSLVLHFSHRGWGEQAFSRDTMLQLQELACLSARQGIMCLAEQRHVRPKWESWILCEAKRRTTYVMYMFDSLLLAEDNLPSFLGSELCGLPAPASRRLWYATERSEWEKAYNAHLADWTTCGLKIEELWPPPVDSHDASLSERRKRVDAWLEDLDEFGVMLFTVTSCTHGT